MWNLLAVDFDKRSCYNQFPGILKAVVKMRQLF